MYEYLYYTTAFQINMSTEDLEFMIKNTKQGEYQIFFSECIGYDIDYEKLTPKMYLVEKISENSGEQFKLIDTLFKMPPLKKESGANVDERTYPTSLATVYLTKGDEHYPLQVKDERIIKLYSYISPIFESSKLNLNNKWCKNYEIKPLF